VSLLYLIVFLATVARAKTDEINNDGFIMWALFSISDALWAILIWKVVTG